MTCTDIDPKKFYLKGTIAFGATINIVAQDIKGIYHYLTYNKDKKLLAFNPKYKTDSSNNITNDEPVLNCIITYYETTSHDFNLSFKDDDKIYYLKPINGSGNSFMSYDDKEYRFTYTTLFNIHQIIAGISVILLDNTSSHKQINWQSYDYNSQSKINDYFVDNNNPDTVYNNKILSVRFLPTQVYEFGTGLPVPNYIPIIIDAKWITGNLDANYTKFANQAEAKANNSDPRYCTLKQDCDLDNCYTINCGKNSICDYDIINNKYSCQFILKNGNIDSTKSALYFLMVCLVIIISATFALFGNTVLEKVIRGIIMLIFLVLLGFMFSYFLRI